MNNFDLERAMAQWRRQYRYRGRFLREDLDELERHLRDHIAHLQREGLSSQQAFHEASCVLGEAASAEAEYRKVYWRKLKRRGERLTDIQWRLAMWSNYLKIALRNLKRHPVYASINVLGLAVGMAVCLLVIAVIRDQANHDAFHKHADQIYRVISDGRSSADGTLHTYATSPPLLAPLLQNEIPEIQETVRLRRMAEASSFGDERFGVSGFYADASFFRVFSFGLVAGDPQSALNEPHSIVLTPAAALRFFGGDDPLGQTLTIDEVGNFTVTGVFADPPMRSHLEFEAVASLSTVLSADDMSNTPDWSALTYYTYLLLDEHADPSALTAKLPDVVRPYTTEVQAGASRFDLQALADINLGPILARETGAIVPTAFAYFLAALALVVLLAACINYINLSVARALKRAKEVGVRKVVGASRVQIVRQFLSEAVLIALCAFVVALLLFFVVLLPQWNSLLLVQNDFGPVALDFGQDMELYLLFIALSLIVGVLAGLYPALHLSSFRPAKVLKGIIRNRQGSGMLLRKGLIVFQFVLALVFVISTILIYQQSEYFLSADFGFDKEQIVNVELREVPYAAFRDELLRHPDVVDVSATSGLPAVSFKQNVTLVNTETTDSTSAVAYAVDPHFADNLGLTVLAGRTFSEDFPSDWQNALVLNETAARTLHLGSLEEALGRLVDFEGQQRQVIGIVQDFQFDFLWNPIAPLVLHHDPAQYRYANIRLRPGDPTEALAFAEATWKQLAPLRPFEYQYLDAQIASNYADFKDFIWITGLIAALAILIACFGLLAMAHYSAELRTKEVGVRKVMGASVGSVMLLLSRSYLKLILIAFVVGLPATWFLNNLWMQFFANRVDMSLVVFAGGVLAVLVLALLAIGSQTMRAALVDPVKSLRYE